MTTISHVVVLRLLRNTFTKRTREKLRIIDFGCGAGSFYPKLRTLAKNIEYIGCDINEQSITVAKKLFSKKQGAYPKFFTLTNPDKYTLGATANVDAVSAVGVVQYLSKAQRALFLKQTHNVLKKNGHLVISCLSDHSLYKLLDLYRFLVPHGSVNRSEFVLELQSLGFTIQESFEKGLIFAPFFSHVLSLGFDVIDVLLYGKTGSIGPMGKLARKLADPLIALEYKMPIDYGYTLFIVAQK